ncbi:helix-turn-helix domain-containing protein [Falsirhodobacter xinxiangensis]|uniref:helix-turn-helix domain-containing protein n=1 Tax=Falsirhodobacter xinxiangensis TaxID=2530049 RepID=UPI0010A9B4E4|nr:helix-turn-helix transcriptional regulator [Rhodobacter xinxiangensis]
MLVKTKIFSIVSSDAPNSRWGKTVKNPKKKPKFESDGRKELEQIRWRLGLTQRQFAIGVGLKPSTYEGYERGLHKLPNSVLVSARALAGC